MHIVFFAHPAFLTHQSMPRFVRMLADGMSARGHIVDVWFPQARFFGMPAPKAARKWLGYVDQYLVFPNEVRSRLKQCPADTLFVITDNALGPWVPLVAKRPHVIHCHDFLAQRSALGQIPEHPTSWTGQRYQSYIRRGYSQGKHFIAVSEKTRQDLCEILPNPPASAEVVYNGLNQAFSPGDPAKVREILSNTFKLDLTAGYLLHVGGNIWYKNRQGVVDLYNAWRSKSKFKLPLLLIGESPTPALRESIEQSPFKEDIHSFSGVKDADVRLVYQGGSLFVFPSLAEGFGWPIAEAMASGCPVLTTDEAPMSEVAGTAGLLIPRRPNDSTEVGAWADKGAAVIEQFFNLSLAERQVVIERGIQNSERFNTEKNLDRIEQIYSRIAKQITQPERRKHQPVGS